MSAPPCACEVCEAAYADLRAERELDAARLSAAAEDAIEELRLFAIQLGAAFRVLPSQLVSQLRKKRK